MRLFKYILWGIIIVFFHSCSTESYIYVNKTQFIKNEKPYHYIGTNYWYGAMLAAESGDRKRLIKELDEMKSLGITNLRVLACSEGGDKDFMVKPATQPSPNIYNEELLRGLDFLLNEMRKRNMDAVLYLTNSWDWSGGMPKYLEWNGYGKIPDASAGSIGWSQYTQYMSQFQECEPCKKALLNNIKYIINRKNTINGVNYKDDKTIMSWEIANEPRIWTVENESRFTDWINNIAAEIKALDKNHLVTTGSEGSVGSNLDIQAFERTHRSPQIDYLTIHIWPKNWTWYNKLDEEKSLEISLEKTLNYIDNHILVANKLQKPLVLEEFGFPRAQESLSKSSSVALRNQYYKAIFEKFRNEVNAKSPFAALNFWGYAGIAENNQKDGKWNLGDDYTADPPQEPQGLNSVFSSDKETLELIKKYNELIKSK